MSKLPAIQFYPGDWKKDSGVQSLSFHDRGVWFEILLLMHESTERGKLLLGGKAMPQEALARLLGLDNQILTTTLTTLLEYGVASLCEKTGALCSRRMIRDEEIRQVRAEAGKKGGNPNLLNQNQTTVVNQNTTPSSSFSISTSSSDIETQGETPAVVKPKRAKAFVKPSVQQIIDYVLEIQAAIDAKYFWDYYEAVGWRVGRNGSPMKDWKAVVRQWQSRNNQQGNGHARTGYQTAAEKREQLNASGFDIIRQAAAEAAALASGNHGGNLPSRTGKTLFLEEHGSVDASCL